MLMSTSAICTFDGSESKLTSLIAVTLAAVAVAVGMWHFTGEPINVVVA